MTIATRSRRPTEASDNSVEDRINAGRIDGERPSSKGIRDRAKKTFGSATLPPVLFGLLFLLILSINLFGNGFPIYWHAEEAGKALQLQTGRYNFYHPQLLLRIAAITDFLMPGDSVRDAVIAGRTASALAASIAAIGFGVLVFRRFGWLYGLLTAALVTIMPGVFINAHFYKEDSVLLMGIAVSMLGLQHFDESPTRSRACLLGLTIGLACSAKYIGMIMLIPAAVLLVHRRAGWAGFGLCLAGIFLVFSLVNSTTLLNPANLSRGFMFEIDHVSTGHGGLVWGPLSPRSLLHFWDNSSPAIIAAFLAGAVLSYNHARAMDRIVIFLPLLWLAAVQLSSVSFARYALPAAALCCVAAVWTAALLPPSRAAWKAILVAGIIGGGVLTLRPFAAAAASFVNNPRDRSAAWIRDNLPPTAVIAAEFYAGLPTPQRVLVDPTRAELRQRVSLAVNFGLMSSLEHLRNQGVTHLVVSSAHFARYFDRFATLSGPAQAQRGVYEELFRRTPLHEEAESHETGYIMSSRILIYDITN
ncbi:glycosyltransferase family 39 protein [Bradyrhizobium sp.]|uniref:ArnT family glycosyltransferase n=1 Tax=Bradyrhizobium sp. TaxID=376 RepID=UPI002735BA6E|nr:phospholipid carrier-dependent glycosyltransferase [Bradyrhizobium sp.]MDP3692560.1 phospholipid carrier-dependent glycosyltransferase [Bradyrhizobium sp.]